MSYAQNTITCIRHYFRKRYNRKVTICNRRAAAKSSCGVLYYSTTRSYSGNNTCRTINCCYSSIIARPGSTCCSICKSITTSCTQGSNSSIWCSRVSSINCNSSRFTGDTTDRACIGIGYSNICTSPSCTRYTRKNTRSCINNCSSSISTFPYPPLCGV